MPPNSTVPHTAVNEFRRELEKFRTVQAGHPSFSDISRALDKLGSDVAVSADTVSNIFHGTSLSKWKTIDAIIEVLLGEAKIAESEHAQIVERFKALWITARSSKGEPTDTTQLSETTDTAFLPRVSPHRVKAVRYEYDPLEHTNAMRSRDLVMQIDKQIGRGLCEFLGPGVALLVIKRGPNAGSRFFLDAPHIDVGRDPESDVFLDDLTVSRRHAFFTRTLENRWLVSDNNSLNSVYVNREAVDESQLKTGDEIQIGKFRLVHLEPRVWTELSMTMKAKLLDLEEPDS